MGIVDVGAAMIVSLPNLCVPAKRGLGRMTTRQFDVEFNGHIVIDAESEEEACNTAQAILDKSGAYIYIENAEVY